MKRFFPTVCLAAAISLSLSVIWPSLSSAAMPTLVPLGQLRVQGLDVPGAMAVDGAGNLYVADSRGGEVFKFDRYGRQKGVFAVQASGAGLAVSPDGGRLYVARKQSVALVSPADGAVLGELADAVFDQTGEIACDDDGRLFVVDAGSQKLTVSVFSPSGALLATLGGLGAENGKFMQIGGLAVNPLGQLVVVDPSAVNGRVQVFTLDPATLTVTAVNVYGNASAANFGTPGLVVPAGVAFDPQGRGYFLDFLGSQVRVVDPAMAFLGSYGQSGVEPGMLAYVKDAVVETGTDSATGKTSSRLFISCDGGRIEIFGIDGGVSPVFVNHAPAVPVIQGPAAGSEVTSAAPSLQFAAAVDIDGDTLTYQVSVYRGDELVTTVTTPETTVALAPGLLAENSVYAWTVQAFDSEGAGSGASAPAVFVVNAVDEPPAAPQPVAPLAGEVLAGDGLLAWQAVVDPDPNDTLIGYRVDVAGPAGFASPLLSAQVGGLEVALADFAAYGSLVDGATYAWRVVAVDSDGLVSAPGAEGRFVYDTALLAVTANIPGARVYLGGNHGYPGQLLGDAPLEVRDLAPGTFSLVIERAGFEPFVTQVGVAGQGNAAVYAKLDPAMQPSSFKQVTYGINGRTGLKVNGAAVPYLADFDNDGRTDLLVGDNAGGLTIFPAMQVNSQGQLTFQAGRSLGLPVLPGAVPSVADWNSDGRKDVLVGRADGLVTLFLNAGTETAPAFGAGQELTAAGSTLSVGSKAAPAVIDLNGDGAKDLVVGNGAGQVQLFVNQGTDAAPQLAAATLLFQLQGAAVPQAVDWKADGARDLLVTAGGKSTVYRNDLAVTGKFVAETSYLVSTLNAAFPLDVDGVRGKDLLVGLTAGNLALWSGSATAFTPAFLAALTVKVDEVAALVAEVAPASLAQVETIRQQIAAKNYAGAAQTADALALQLPAGVARTAALELAELCKAK